MSSLKLHLASHGQTDSTHFSPQAAIIQRLQDEVLELRSRLLQSRFDCSNYCDREMSNQNKDFKPCKNVFKRRFWFCSIFFSSPFREFYFFLHNTQHAQSNLGYCISSVYSISVMSSYIVWPFMDTNWAVLPEAAKPVRKLSPVNKAAERKVDFTWIIGDCNFCQAKLLASQSDFSFHSVFVWCKL